MSYCSPVSHFLLLYIFPNLSLIHHHQPNQPQFHEMAMAPQIIGPLHIVCCRGSYTRICTNCVLKTNNASFAIFARVFEKNASLFTYWSSHLSQLTSHHPLLLHPVDSSATFLIFKNHNNNNNIKDKDKHCNKDSVKNGERKEIVKVMLTWWNMIGSSEEQLLKLENDMKEKILIYR